MTMYEVITAVARMQAYITRHLDEEIVLADLAEAAGYSKYHALRVYKRLTGRTPFETIRALRLTRAAQVLQSSADNVVNVAIAYGFDSHDGFTKAFARQFAITPQKYRQETPPIPWFISYPIEAYYQLKEGKDTVTNQTAPLLVTVTPVDRPARKLILKRTLRATDYLSMCEEVGCEWKGIFNSIPEKLDTFCGCDLPPSMIAPGTGPLAFGVEVPAGYAKPIPEGCDVIDLPSCTLLFFQSAPYEKEEDFSLAYDSVYGAVAVYRPEQYGWLFAPELAPKCTFEARAATGARQALPVRKV